MLHETLRKDMQSAMKAKDTVRLETLRMALTTCTNTLVEQGKKPNEKLEDDAVVQALKRLVKQRKESAEQYRNANQEERAKVEEAEEVILKEYLPPEMPEEEIKAIVTKKQQELGVSEKKDTGALIQAVMKEVKGKADGSVVAKIVGEVLQKRMICFHRAKKVIYTAQGTAKFASYAPWK